MSCGYGRGCGVFVGVAVGMGGECFVGDGALCFVMHFVEFCKIIVWFCVMVCFGFVMVLVLCDGLLFRNKMLLR